MYRKRLRGSFSVLNKDTSVLAECAINTLIQLIDYMCSLPLMDTLYGVHVWVSFNPSPAHSTGTPGLLAWPMSRDTCAGKIAAGFRNELGFGWASHRALQTHILCVLHSTSALNHTLPSFSMWDFFRKIKIFSEDCFMENCQNKHYIVLTRRIYSLSFVKWLKHVLTQQQQ